MTRSNAMLLSLMFLLSTLVAPVAAAQEKPDSPLHATFMALDRQLFDEGFNECNLDVLGQLVRDDLEFFHDVAGVQNRAQFMKAMQDNICSNMDKKPIRKLVAGSMQVFPLYANGKLYGAIQNGAHEFHMREPGKALYRTGVARFTSLWMLQDGKWQLKVALSFDHRAAN